MKKVFFTVAIAAAFAFGMTACNNTPAEEENTDSVATEEVVEECCAHNCQDSVCAATNCENCTKRGTDECCKVKAGEACEHQCNHEGEGQCEHKCNHEGEHQCEHNCNHAK